MTPFSEHAKGFSVLFKRGILTHDEEGDRRGSPDPVALGEAVFSKDNLAMPRFET